MTIMLLPVPQGDPVKQHVAVLGHSEVLKGLGFSRGSLTRRTSPGKREQNAFAPPIGFRHQVLPEVVVVVVNCLKSNYSKQ